MYLFKSKENVKYLSNPILYMLKSMKKKKKNFCKLMLYNINVDPYNMNEKYKKSLTKI